MSSESMVTCASGLLPNPAKVPYFQYRALWYSIVQKFHNDGQKFKHHNFEPILAYGHDPAKVPKFQNWAWWYSIDWKFHSFILMIKNHILLFQLPGNWPITKKCVLYSRGNPEFPIYFSYNFIFFLELIVFTRIYCAFFPRIYLFFPRFFFHEFVVFSLRIY
jgi:hypothetical protein